MPVGPSPFNKDFSDWYSKKRHTGNKKEMKGLRKLRSSLTGDVYMLPSHDYHELVKHFKEHESELSDVYKSDNKQLYKNIQTPADYIDFAFEKKSQQKNLVTQECKGGHILKLTYNPLYKLLMVEFTNRGDVCVFFNLPANVAAELMHFAENNTMGISSRDGTQRHMVGIYFWDLVRVRGTVHDTRYPFQYTKDFRTGKAFGARPNPYSKWVTMKLDENTGGYVTNDGQDASGVYNTQDKRYKNKDGQLDKEVNRRHGVQRMLRSDFDRARAALDKEAASDKYTAEDIDWDDVFDFFDNGTVDNLLGKVKGTKLKNLREAIRQWDNDLINENNYWRIAEIMEKNGTPIPKLRKSKDDEE